MAGKRFEVELPEEVLAGLGWQEGEVPDRMREAMVMELLRRDRISKAEAAAILDLDRRELLDVMELYPDQACQAMNKSLTRKFRSILSRAITFMCASTLSQLCREWDDAQQQAAVVMAHGAEHEFTLLLAQGTFLHGHALVALGQTTKGIEQLQQGLAAYLETGAEVWRPMYLSMFAAACEQSGQIVGGLDYVTEALEIVETTQERWWEPELYRQRGVLLLERSSGHHNTEAESCFHQALEVARSQQAKSWELRAATSLARLWQSQGKRDEAHELLEPVYSWFTEGFDTADLVDAKALLDELIIDKGVSRWTE